MPVKCPYVTDAPFVPFLLPLKSGEAIAKETRKYLATVPNRFEFIFTTTHGSWLNIIESLFAKMAKTFLRAIRVDSKDDLKQRILKWIDEVNSTPVVFRWKYGLDLISVKN